jgi:histidinol phosphatase-like enzyme (inositol monophosphatase family)
MSAYDPAGDIRTAHLMADAARAAILPHFRAPLDVENKLDAGFDPVTAADRASERAMRTVLAQHAPDDGILGEEFGETAGANGRRWVLDPIDGTRAFIAGLPTWTVLIALERAGRPAVGVIDQPHIGERFLGWPGGALLFHGGAERPLRTRDTRSLDTAILSTTDAFLFADAEAQAFEQVRQRARLCRFGFDAYAYAMLASGGVDLVIESGLQVYDVQAFIPVIEGAGGVVTDWAGGDPSGGGQVVAAASRALLDAVLPLLAPAATS